MSLKFQYLLKKQNGDYFVFYSKKKALSKVEAGDELLEAIRNDFAKFCGYSPHYFKIDIENETKKLNTWQDLKPKKEVIQMELDFDGTIALF